MGYLESRYPGGRRVLAQDVVERYDLGRTRMASRLVAQNPVLSLTLVLGDVELDELDLDARAVARRHPGLLGMRGGHMYGLLVTGDLRVRGPIHSVDEGHTLSLFVMGQLRARTVAVNGPEIVVRGRTMVEDVLCGSGSATEGGPGAGGQAWFDGDVAARLLICDDYAIWVGGRLSAPVLETGNTHVGIVGHTGVRPVAGDIPFSVVLSDDVRDHPARGRGHEQFSFPTFVAAVRAGRPLLAQAFGAGAVDLDALRERRLLLRQADAAMAEGHYLMAAELFRAAIGRGAPRTATTFHLAEALYRAHVVSQDRPGLRTALELLNDVLAGEVDPDAIEGYPAALVRRASILLLLDDDDEHVLEQAWADCAGALSYIAQGHPAADVDLAGTYDLMGRWLITRNRYDDALPYLERALALDPQNAGAHGDLARCLWMLDREDEAVPHATRSLELNTSDDYLWFVRGKCRQRLGDTAGARMDLLTYLELHPDDQLSVEALLQLALADGQARAAVDRARAFLARRPADAQAHARVGRLLTAHELYVEAVPFLAQAVRLLEGHDATADLGRSMDIHLVDDPGLARALRAYETDYDGDHLDHLRAECLRVLDGEGDRESSARDRDRAEADLRRHLQRHPDDVTARVSLARLRFAEGDDEEAAELLAAAREQAPDDVYVELAAAETVPQRADGAA